MLIDSLKNVTDYTYIKLKYVAQTSEDNKQNIIARLPEQVLVERISGALEHNGSLLI